MNASAERMGKTEWHQRRDPIKIEPIKVISYQTKVIIESKKRESKKRESKMKKKRIEDIKPCSYRLRIRGAIADHRFLIISIAGRRKIVIAEETEWIQNDKQ